MTPLDPRPHSVQELAISFLDGLLTAARREVAAPPSADRVKRQAQRRLPGRLVLSHDLSSSAMMPVNRFRAGFDEGLEAKPGRADGILSDVTPQEVEAHHPCVLLECVDDGRFTRLQFQPHAFECPRHACLAWLYCLAVWV
jgi:hypothetical protein